MQAAVVVRRGLLAVTAVTTMITAVPAAVRWW